MALRAFASLTMSWKIAGLAIGSAFVSAVGVGVVALSISEDAALQAMEARKAAVVEARASRFESAMRSRADTLRFVAGSTGVSAALRQFQNAATGEARDVWPELRRSYIDENPNPAGRRHEMLEAPDASMFSIYHKMHHGTFVELMKLHRFSDVTLINAEGRVIYSAAKRDDFGADLTSDAWARSGLARAWMGVKDAEAGGVWSLVDLAPYAAAGAPEAFIAAPVFDARGQRLGTVAVAVPARLYTNHVILGDDSPEGVSVYLLGADGTMRSDVIGASVGGVMAPGPQNALIETAFEKGYDQGVSTGLFSDDASMAARLVQIGEVAWLVVAEEPRDRAMAGVYALRYSILTATGLLVLLAGLGAWLMSRGLSGPLRRMARDVEQLADGALIEIQGRDRGDEIGVLARSLQLIHDSAVIAHRIRTALGGAASAMTITDAEFRVVFTNRAMDALMAQSGAYWTSHAPKIAAEGLVGRDLENVLSELGALRAELDSGEESASMVVSFDDRAFDVTGAAVADADGALMGYALQWTEITERRQVEQEIAHVIKSVGQGVLDVRIETHIADWAMRDMAEGVNRICEIVDGFMGELDRSLRALSTGDLSVRMDGSHKGRFAELSSRLNTAIGEVDRIAAGIRQATDAVRASGGMISQNATDLSERAASQAASLEETSATMEQIAATVKANASHADTANDLAVDASTRAGSGKAVVSDAVDAMTRIEDSSSKISDIITVIDGIAFQTNLLALNAAVEAARAGEAGKGFAVVASEVRTLAQRSAEAAKDIKGLIEKSASQVSDGVRLVRETGDALEEMVSSVDRVSETITEISSGGRQQASGVTEISGAVSAMEELTQANAKLAEESAKQANALTDEATRLAQLASFFGGGAAAADHVAAAPEEQAADADWAEVAAAHEPAPPHAPATPTRGPARSDDWAEF